MLYMIFGTLGAAITGAALPVFSLLWGSMTDAFAKSQTDPDAMTNAAK
jgi:cell division protein FtsX